MTRARALAAVAIAAVAAFPTAIAAKSHRKAPRVKASTAKYWENSAVTVLCGLERPRPHKKATVVLCSSHGIPRPKRAPLGVHPGVQITKKGRPKLVVIKDFEWVVVAHTTTLANGATWSSLGVTCKIGATVSCQNRSRHGFRIGNNKYKSF